MNILCRVCPEVVACHLRRGSRLFGMADGTGGELSVRPGSVLMVAVLVQGFGVRSAAQALEFRKLGPLACFDLERNTR